MIENGLERAIVENPASLDAYLAYANWLKAESDPRGELIVVQAALARAPDSRELLERQAALLAQHGDRWLGLLAGHRAKTVTWRLGFLDEIEIRKAPAKGVVCSQLIAQALHAPVGRLVRKLSLDLDYGWEEKDAATIARAIADARPSLLGELSLRVHPHLLRDLGALWAALPQLAELTYIEKTSSNSYRAAPPTRPLQLGDLDAPRLRRLTLATASPVHGWSAAIVDARCPELERLEMSMGSPTHFEPAQLAADLAALARILDVRRPKLKHLALHGCTLFIDELCGVIGKSKILAQLETLDLSGNRMSNDGALALGCEAPAFAHLRRLDLEENLLDGEGRALVKDLCAEVLVAGQLKADGGP